MSLEDKKITNFSKPVSEMPDVPGAAGYTAAQVKEWFDSNSSVELKNSVNGVIDFLLGFTDGEEIKGIRVTEDNVLEVTKDGNTYISTGYSKSSIINMLSQKVDKSDVLLKTNTEEFTPTGIYQPATKKYVDDKVVTAGAADMTQAVYDPTGRQTDIFAEVDKKFDKAGGILSGDLSIKNGSGRFTATESSAQIEVVNDEADADKRMLRISNRYEEDISTSLSLLEEKDGDTYSYSIFGEHNLNILEKHALPIAGGTLTGQSVYFGNGIGRVYFQSKGMQLESINVANDTSNKRTLFMQNSAGRQLSSCLRLVDRADGKDMYYNIFGQHNKPSGSYTGNGSSAERKISVGGAGDVLLVRSLRDCYFVTPEGFKYSSDSINGTNYTTTFIDGVLTLSGGSFLNESGVAYYYQVL